MTQALQQALDALMPYKSTVLRNAKEAADALERLEAELNSIKEKNAPEIGSINAYITNLTIENAQLQKDYTRIKESATLWHDRYKTKCQEYMDRQAILGAEIVALEAERDAWQTAYGRADEVCDGLLIENAALKEGLDGWHSRYLDCEVERDALAQNAERVRVYKHRYFGAIAERDALAGEKT